MISSSSGSHVKRHHSITLAAVVTLVAATVHLWASQGCISLHSTRTMHARAIDWNTGEPLRFATFSVRYMRYLGGPLNVPDDVTVQTEERGEADVRVSDPKVPIGIYSERGMAGFRSANDVLSHGGLIFLYEGDGWISEEPKKRSAVIELTLPNKR